MINALESATLCVIRLSEIFHPDPAPTLQNFIDIQINGNPFSPVDFYCDARDVFELVTGTKTLPQDKTQRLYVLAFREARLHGRVRMFVLIPTECMVADPLTKSMLHETLFCLLSCGIVTELKSIRSRREFCLQ